MIYDVKHLVSSCIYRITWNETFHKPYELFTDGLYQAGEAPPSEFKKNFHTFLNSIPMIFDSVEI